MSLRERGKLERVHRILQAAKTLLREHPDEVPRTEAIAELAAVSPATVFNLVGTREQLWAALADESLATLEREIERLPATLEPQERARRIVTTMARILAADAPVYRAVLAHWRGSGRLLRRDPTRAIAACLEQARETGELRPDADPGALADLVATGCTGAAHQWAAEMIDDRTLVARSRAMADLAFEAARAR